MAHHAPHSMHAPAGGQGKDTLAGTLQALLNLIDTPSWHQNASLKEAVRLTAKVLLQVNENGSSAARSTAKLFARALERIGRGRWPAKEPYHAFLTECVHSLAAQFGVTLLRPTQSSPVERQPQRQEKSSKKESAVAGPDAPQRRRRTQKPAPTPSLPAEVERKRAFPPEASSTGTPLPQASALPEEPLAIFLSEEGDSLTPGCDRS